MTLSGEIAIVVLSTHAEAQAFFEAAVSAGAGGHGLDGDSDGIACESLP